MSEEIKSVVIFGKTNCTYCEQSKALAKANDIPFEYKMLDTDYSIEELMEKVNEPFRTFPQIFINDNVYLGSFPELKKAIQEKKQKAENLDLGDVDL